MPFKISSLYSHQSHNSQPLFSKLLGRKTLLLYTDINLQLMLKERNQMMGERERERGNSFILVVHTTILIIASKHRSTWCFLLSENELTLLQTEPGSERWRSQ